MKRIVTGLLCAAFLFSIGGALAGNAGSSSDPFVTRSYIDGDYKAAILAETKNTVSSATTGVYNSALKKLTSSYNGYKSSLSASNGYQFAASNQQFVMSAGSAVTGTVGTVFTLVSGGVTVSVSGALVDVTNGSEVPSGTALTAGTRYICAEDSTVTFRAGAESVCVVSGYYKTSGSVEKPFAAYSDVAPTDWYYPYAKFVYETALFHDWNAGTFRQGAVADRATIVYALWRLCGAPSPAGVSVFTDLKETWYVPAVTWASENGIVEGYGDGRFGPKDSVTREQVACFMYRFAKYRGYSLDNDVDLSSYTDSKKISDWALEEMKWANKQRLITGVTETTLVPQGVATRAEVAAITNRYAA